METLIVFGSIIVLLLLIIIPNLKVISEWERYAILTLGRYSGLKGPGLVIVWPIIQAIASRIDMRTTANKFQAETTLTKDSVAVTVQAVLFWKVVNAEHATLAVSNYKEAVELAAQTTLRDVIGRMTLGSILSNLEELDQTLKERIGQKVARWGVDVQGVEIRDVSIPSQLQEVMSRAAQAEREKQARITYGEAEIEAARKYVEASNIYGSNPSALNLRAMSIMYEAVKNDKNSVIIVPSSIPESMSPLALATAINSMQTQSKEKDDDGTITIE